MPGCPKRFNPCIKRNSGESNKDYIERVYGIFSPLMKNILDNLTYRGKRIEIPDYGEPNRMRAFFNHIIQYEAATGKFNSSRLQYAYSLPQMIINCCDPSCEYCYQKSSIDKRFTIFCESHGYVIFEFPVFTK